MVAALFIVNQNLQKDFMTASQSKHLQYHLPESQNSLFDLLFIGNQLKVIFDFYYLDLRIKNFTNNQSTANQTMGY